MKNTINGRLNENYIPSKFSSSDVNDEYGGATTESHEPIEHSSNEISSI